MNIWKDTRRLVILPDDVDSECKGRFDPTPTVLNLLVLIPWELR
jgi:hypothetical protein